jgi:ubiquinone/menaquinone biosynthesis C-methylase UbiE
MDVIKDPEGNETAQLAAIKALAGTHVLEIGCGDGRMTWRYAALPRSIMAFDSDADKLAAAEAGRPSHHHRSVTFLQASAEAIPFASERFDAAILAWSL